MKKVISFIIIQIIFFNIFNIYGLALPAMDIKVKQDMRILADKVKNLPPEIIISILQFMDLPYAKKWIAGLKNIAKDNTKKTIPVLDQLNRITKESTNIGYTYEIKVTDTILSKISEKELEKLVESMNENIADRCLELEIPLLLLLYKKNLLYKFLSNRTLKYGCFKKLVKQEILQRQLMKAILNWKDDNKELKNKEQRKKDAYLLEKILECGGSFLEEHKTHIMDLLEKFKYDECLKKVCHSLEFWEEFLKVKNEQEIRDLINKYNEKGFFINICGYIEEDLKTKKKQTRWYLYSVLSLVMHGRLYDNFLDLKQKEAFEFMKDLIAKGANANADIQIAYNGKNKVNGKWDRNYEFKLRLLPYLFFEGTEEMAGYLSNKGLRMFQHEIITWTEETFCKSSFKNMLKRLAFLKELGIVEHNFIKDYCRFSLFRLAKYHDYYKERNVLAEYLADYCQDDNKYILEVLSRALQKYDLEIINCLIEKKIKFTLNEIENVVCNAVNILRICKYKGSAERKIKNCVKSMDFLIRKGIFKLNDRVINKLIRIADELKFGKEILINFLKKSNEYNEKNILKKEIVKKGNIIDESVIKFLRQIKIKPNEDDILFANLDRDKINKLLKAPYKVLLKQEFEREKYKLDNVRYEDEKNKLSQDFLTDMNAYSFSGMEIEEVYVCTRITKVINVLIKNKKDVLESLKKYCRKRDLINSKVLDYMIENKLEYIDEVRSFSNIFRRIISDAILEANS